MFFDDTIIDAYERDIMRFTNSPEYVKKRNNNTLLIQAFRSTLSPEQQRQFNMILNNLSEENADLSLAAYSEGLLHEKQNIESYDH